MDPRYGNTQLKLTGTRNSFINRQVNMNEYIIIIKKMVCSYPFVVRLSQIGKLNSSLGVPKPSYMLEIIHPMDIDFLGKAIENLGGESLVDRAGFN